MKLKYQIRTAPGHLTEFRVVTLDKLEFGRDKKSRMGKWHSFIYVSHGNGLVWIDFDEHIALRNKLFFIEKYKSLRWLKTDNLEGWMVQFTDSFYNHIYTGNPKIKSDESLAGEFSPFIKIDDKSEVEWDALLKIILKEYTAPGLNSSEIICLGLKMLVMMYRRNTLSTGRMIIASRKKQLITDFRKLVNTRFVELRTPKGFAHELHISPNYLNAVCKEIYNKTVSEIIQERVTLEAKRLLAHTGLSVSEISFKLGFEDNSYFGRYFKKHVGISPDKYRRNA